MTEEYWAVVYQSFPTSNHNAATSGSVRPSVVYQSFPTSNHNHRIDPYNWTQLFTSLFLHQTTTKELRLYYDRGCLPVFSYIKPQLRFSCKVTTGVVYQSFPTSNHNFVGSHDCHRVLFTSLFLHQTTTSSGVSSTCQGLFTSLFLHQTTTSYTKYGAMPRLFTSLFLHQTTTSQS